MHDHHHADNMDIFGFWLYILSDCILFAVIFSCFSILHNNLYGGPEIKTLIEIPYIFVETIILLLSSFTYGMAILSSYKNKTKWVMAWLVVTCLLGLSFIGMEINEFINLYAEGHTWQSNAALSAFFTLVGTHGLHVFSGSLWMCVLIAQLCTFGLTPVLRKRLTYLGLFWAFLDIVWIFVFTIVYLMEAI